MPKITMWNVRYTQGRKPKQRLFEGVNAESEARLFAEKIKRNGHQYELSKSVMIVPRLGKLGRVLDCLQHGEIRFGGGELRFMEMYKYAVAALVIYTVWHWLRGN